MKSLLDLLRDESFLITKYNQHIENAECWESNKAHCNPKSGLKIERDDYWHYANLEKASRDKAAECALEIAEIRQQILGYLGDMIEEDKPKKKSLLARFFKK